MDEGKVQRARRPGKQLAKCQNQLKYEVQGIAKNDQYCRIHARFTGHRGHKVLKDSAFLYGFATLV